MTKYTRVKAWYAFWDYVEHVVGIETRDVLTDNQKNLRSLIQRFAETNPTIAEIEAFGFVIVTAANIGKTLQYRKPNQTLKDAAIELFAPFESDIPKPADDSEKNWYKFELNKGWYVIVMAFTRVEAKLKYEKEYPNAESIIIDEGTGEAPTEGVVAMLLG